MSVDHTIVSTMSVVLKLVVLSAIILLCPLAHSQSFVEGTHYSIVDGANQPGSAKEIVEYFSYSCPGCNALEPHIKALQQQLPTLSLRRVHLPFGGRKADISQEAFVLMKLLSATQHHQKVFDRIHVQQNVFNNQQELIDFFVNLDYDELRVKQALNSFAADTMLRKMNQEANKQGILLVPTIIVNRKYQVNLKAVYSGTSLAALLEYLYSLP